MEGTIANRLEGISPEAYRHPLDLAATATLQRIPHFDSVMRRLLTLNVDLAARANLMAGAVRFGEDQLPKVWLLHKAVFEALNMEAAPELYLQEDPTINAMAGRGTRGPIIVINSRLVEVLDEAGVKAILGHEAAHVHCDHVLYGTVLGFLGWFAAAMMPPAFSGLPVAAISYALRPGRDPPLGGDAVHPSADRSAGPSPDGLGRLRRLRPSDRRRLRPTCEEGSFRREADEAARRYARQLDRLAIDGGGESLAAMGDEIGTWLEKAEATDLDGASHVS